MPVALALLVAIGAIGATPAGDEAHGVAATRASSADQRRAAPATPTACSLLTPDEIRAVVSGSVGPGSNQTSTRTPSTGCSWYVQRPHSSFTTNLALLVQSGITPADFQQIQRGGAVVGKTQRIKHLGDAAFSTRISVKRFKPYPNLWVRKGSIAILLNPPEGGALSKQLDSLKKLARIVLNRLP